LRSEVRNAPVAYSIAASNSVLHWLVLPQLKAITTALPAVKWTLHHESTSATAEKVSTGQIDFGMCIGTPGVAALKRRYLGDVEYALFVPARMAHATDAAQVLHEVPLALPIGGALRASLDAWARRARIDLHPALEVDSYLRAADAVVRGTHAAVLPSLARRTVPQEVRSLSLPAPAAQRRKLWLIWTDRLLRTRTAAEGVRNVLIDVLSS
jgi:hypothetical protein